MADAGEDGLQAVVVGLLDGVEFVIVAAGAVDGEAEEGAAGGGDDVVEIVGALLQPAGEIANADGVVGSGDQEAGGGFDGGVTGMELVGGELLDDEAIEGLVAVEGTDDVVAVGPGVFAEVILLEAVTFAEANDVEPVASPALAIVRGG